MEITKRIWQHPYKRHTPFEMIQPLELMEQEGLILGLKFVVVHLILTHSDYNTKFPLHKQPKNHTQDISFLFLYYLLEVPSL